MLAQEGKRKESEKGEGSGTGSLSPFTVRQCQAPCHHRAMLRSPVFLPAHRDAHWTSVNLLAALQCRVSAIAVVFVVILRCPACCECMTDLPCITAYVACKTDVHASVAAGRWRVCCRLHRWAA